MKLTTQKQSRQIRYVRPVQFVAVITVVLALAFAGRTAQLGISEMRAHGRPMKYALEWITSVPLTNWRVALVKKPGDERWPVYKILTALQGVLYERAMRRLPEEDPERSVYWFRYKLAPFQFFDDARYTEKLRAPAKIMEIELGPRVLPEM